MDGVVEIQHMYRMNSPTGAMLYFCDRGVKIISPLGPLMFYFFPFSFPTWSWLIERPSLLLLLTWHTILYELVDYITRVCFYLPDFSFSPCSQCEETPRRRVVKLCSGQLCRLNRKDYIPGVIKSWQGASGDNPASRTRDSTHFHL